MGQQGPGSQDAKPGKGHVRCEVRRGGGGWGVEGHLNQDHQQSWPYFCIKAVDSKQASIKAEFHFAIFGHSQDTKKSETKCQYPISRLEQSR